METQVARRLSISHAALTRFLSSTTIVLSLVACGRASLHTDSNLGQVDDLVGELGSFKLLLPALTADQKKRIPQNHSFIIVRSAEADDDTAPGIDRGSEAAHVVPGGPAVHVRPGRYCLYLQIPTRPFQGGHEVSTCGINVPKGGESSYLLSALSPIVRNYEVDFGIEPIFRIEFYQPLTERGRLESHPPRRHLGSFVMDPSGKTLYLLPASTAEIKIELQNFYENHHLRSGRRTPHLFSDLGKTISLKHGQIHELEWTLPERRRTIELKH